MCDIFKEINNLKYASGVEFESKVKDILNQSLKQKTKKLSKKEKELWINDNELCDIENNSFLYQPCGTQNSPDFIIKQDKLYFVECKSSKSCYPQYNSGGVNPNYIYVFTNIKHNTTLYLGSDIVTDECTELIQTFTELLRIQCNEFNKKLDNKFGICYYNRPMIIHKGANCNYFEKERKELCEKNVYKYLN